MERTKNFAEKCLKESFRKKYEKVDFEPKI